VVAQLHQRAPPRALHVVLQLDAERAVVPGRARAAVDLARREHEAAALRERGDLVGDVLVCHRLYDRHWIAGTGRGGSARISSMSRAAVTSRSRTCCTKRRMWRSSSPASALSTRSRAAFAKSETRR